jgi:fructokinase
MGTRAVQIRNDRTTGVVQISLDSGQPSYEIVPDQAFDFVDFEQLQAQCGGQLENVAVLYHGSLAWRGSATRNAITELRRCIAAPIFVDLNIRHPWFDPQWLDGILAGVQWVKLNVDELSELTGHAVREDSTESTVANAVHDLMERFPCEICFVSAGASGAYAIDAGGNLVHARAAKIDQLVDTVGAGDAFAAMTIHGLLENWTLPDILQSAVSFAARVCQINGATLNDPGFYSAALHQS